VSRAVSFERYWSDFERPGHPAEESLPPGPEIARAVATATSLRQYAEGLADLDLDSAWESLAARLESPAGEPVSAETSLHSSGPGTSGATVTALRPRSRWSVRVAAASVAAAIVLVTASLGATPGSALYGVRLTVERAAAALSPSQGGVHLRVAEARLGDLLIALRRGPLQAAPGLARSLVRNRATAMRAGADVRDLDLRIALEVPPALLGAPEGIAASVRGILGSLLPPERTRPAGPPSPGGGQEQHPGRGQGGGSDHSGQKDKDQGGRDDHEGRHDDSGSDEHEGSNSDEKSKDHEGSDSDQESEEHEGSNDESHPENSHSDGGSGD
jgi:hypothetical protein